MLTDFIEYVDSLFPSVSESVKNKAKECIRQFEEQHKKINYLMGEPLDDLSQGDIISKIPFTFVSDTGEQRYFYSQGMIISTSCDIDNHDLISFVPLHSLNDYKNDTRVITSNQCLPYMYLPDIKIQDYYVNFETMCSYNKNWILKLLSDGKITRIASLSQVGYYFFLCKFSAFLFRREDTFSQYKRTQTDPNILQ